MGRKFFVGGNWKCNGTTEEVKKIVAILNDAKVPAPDVVDVVVSPPFVFLPLVQSLLRSDFHVAAQNCWVKKGGAYTGEVSAEMLVNLGVTWVIIGHSERRALLGESNEFVGDKVAYALSEGLKVIACVGETLEQREAGSTVDVVAAQTKAIAERISDWTNVVVAYEPVWAIGTGKVATPAQAQEVHFELRKWLKENVSAKVAESTRIIYGEFGSKDEHGLSSFSSKVSNASVPPTPRSEGEILKSSSVRSFAFNELKTATRNFRPDSIVGEGGFGAVFKGWIDEQTYAPAKPGTGIVIAVKKLNQEGFQGHREWLAEVNYLGQLYHPNLVKLIGFCLEDEHRLLVYEFMSRGSLENHLFRRSSFFQPLSWILRVKVALDAAKGLAFLHSAEIKVIYRDFKASNVLLDSNYNAKLSDFGLAKDGPTGDKSHVSTRVMGTHGYAAPEYLATGHLTTKSDVYSFGVVLLELLSGRRAIDKNRPQGEHNLVEWARPYLSNKRKLFSIMDNRLDGQYVRLEAQKVASLALQCLSRNPKFRPSMNQVVSSLGQLQNSRKK